MAVYDTVTHVADGASVGRVDATPAGPACCAARCEGARTDEQPHLGRRGRRGAVRRRVVPVLQRRPARPAALPGRGRPVGAGRPAGAPRRGHPGAGQLRCARPGQRAHARRRGVGVDRGAQRARASSTTCSRASTSPDARCWRVTSALALQAALSRAVVVDQIRRRARASGWRRWSGWRPPACGSSWPAGSTTTPSRTCSGCGASGPCGCSGWRGTPTCRERSSSTTSCRSDRAGRGH